MSGWQIGDETPCGWCGHPRGDHFLDGACLVLPETHPDSCECPAWQEPVE